MHEANQNKIIKLFVVAANGVFLVAFVIEDDYVINDDDYFVIDVILMLLLFCFFVFVVKYLVCALHFPRIRFSKLRSTPACETQSEIQITKNRICILKSFYPKYY